MMNIKKLKALGVAALVFPMVAQASTVAIVDSGTDFEHKDLAGRQWSNPKEVAGNRVDDDRNGKVDDVVGWNFVDDYSRIFFREHLNEINPITYRLFEIIARKQAKAATVDDERFWNDNVVKLDAAQKEALLAHLNFFGQYAHGTHVAGIVASQAPDAKLMVGRIFGDDVPPEYNASPKDSRFSGTLNGAKSKYGVLDFIYKLLAMATNGVFANIAGYLNEQKADVANYSLGVSLKMLAENFLKIKGNKNPSPEEIAAESKRIYVQYEPQGQAWIGASPETLFVIAAGNDGTDNEIFPTFPANVRAPNSITVAASHGFDSLAEFSNYGAVSVDVAAPGVAIDSTVPSLDRSRHLPMSGTSMAAPYVTGVAAHIKDINPALTANQIRTILMETVDKKAWLEGKVVSAGVVNAPRAYEAASMSRSIELTQAIASARGAVADQESGKKPMPVLSERSHRDGSELQKWAERLVF